MVSEVSQMIKAVYDEFVGLEFNNEGNNTFYDFIKPEHICQRHSDGNIILIHETDIEPTGIIEITKENHIRLFFVKKEFHNSGIGTKLFQAVIEKISPAKDYITVNASTYSEKIYAKLGFIKTDDLIIMNGMKFIPMRRKI